MRRIGVLAVLAVAAACSSSPPTVCRAGAGPGGTGGFGGGTAVPIGLTNKPMSVAFELSGPLGCNGAPPMASRVDVAVLDPSNRTVPATATPPAVGSDGQLATTVTFTPLVPGPYHLDVRFEPGLGLVQKDAVVALDKTGVAPVVTGIPVSPPVNCQQIDFDGDTLLCLDTYDASPWLRTIRAAQVVDQVEADAFAFSQGKVWVHSDVDQNLYVYALGSDGRLTAQGSYAASFANQPVMLPQGDLALVLQNDGFNDTQRFLEVRHNSDGSFTASSPVPVESPFGAQWVPDVGATVASSGTEICSFSLGSGEVADGGSCVSGLSVIGFDDDGVWWTDVPPVSTDTVAVHVIGWRAGQSQVATGTAGLLTIAPPNGVYSLYTPQASPVLLGGTSISGVNPSELYVPSFDGRDVTLARYPFISETIHADSKRIWFSGTDTITSYPR